MTSPAPPRTDILIGVAGWSLPSRDASEFPGAGTHLARYARRFNAVEINSCFYRHHRRQTYARWAQSVPEEFRFSVKLPKVLTHGGALDPQPDTLERFADEVAGLGPKLGAVLVQLPPRLAFEPDSARHFFEPLRACLHAPLVCEPRHASWAAPRATQLLERFGIARVAADPARFAADAEAGGDRTVSYFRAHGAPRIYYSNYEADRLAQIARDIRREAHVSRAVWCIFDNTAHGCATGNALSLQQQLLDAPR